MDRITGILAAFLFFAGIGFLILSVFSFIHAQLIVAVLEIALGMGCLWVLNLLSKGIEPKA